MEIATESQDSGENSSAFSSLCLFCATECVDSYAVVDGKTVKINRETLEPIGEADEAEFAEEKLRAKYMVQTILDVKISKSSNIFGKYGGQLPPDFWVSVCLGCQPIVAHYYNDLTNNTKREVSLDFLESMLKLMIKRSIGTVALENGETVRNTTWRAIRQEVLKCFCEDTAIELLKTNTEFLDGFPHFIKLLGTNRQIYNVVIKYEESDSDGEHESEPRVLRSSIKDSVKDKPVNSDEHSNANSNEDSTADSDEHSNADEDSVGESYSPDSKAKSLMPKQKYKFTFYKCKKCGALIEGHQERINRHNKLHKPGRPQKKCEKCGWVVGCVKRHSAYWHSKKAPNLSTKNAAIWPLSVWGKRKEIKLMESDLVHPNFVACSDADTLYRYECRHCSGYKFWKREQAVKHSKMHDEGNGIPCEICGWLVNPATIRCHKAKYHKQTSNNIIEEPKSFPEQERMHNVKAKATKDRQALERKKTCMKLFQTHPQKCGLCEAEFKTKWLLWSHQEEVHKMDTRGRNNDDINMRSKVGLCEVCGKTLQSIRAVHTHKKVHTKNQN